MSRAHCVYILASKPRGALFVGISDDLLNCVLDHKCNLVKGITSQYAINQLVFFEWQDNHDAAIRREQAIRQMHRIWVWARTGRTELSPGDGPGWNG